MTFTDRLAPNSTQTPLLAKLSDINSELNAMHSRHTLALRSKPSETLTSDVAPNVASWTVYCNECDEAMDDVHYHCSICDSGDFDLCESCVDGGKLCPGEGHWLVKRVIKEGKVISSTTERLPPKPRSQIALADLLNTEVDKEMPGAFTEDTKTLNEESLPPTRTCNCCIQGMCQVKHHTDHATDPCLVRPDSEFVTCKSCSDYDLCLECHTENKHGHHPAHSFGPASPETQMSLMQASLLPAGRNVRHQAICDGCDKTIYGVRHKCFTCPDFDYCGTCVKSSRNSHPGHRFAAVYEPISLSPKFSVRHHGIYCDGPACTSQARQTYIEGVRYKCVVCNDTDFCASCEAMPGNFHNKTHPLIKIKTPIRGLNVSTVSENPRGQMRDLGDKNMNSEVKPEVSKGNSLPTESTPGRNTKIPVHTVASIIPSVAPNTTTSTTTAPRTQLSDKPPVSATAGLHAEFIRDAIIDGTSVNVDQCFTQVWTMRNAGPSPWPSGCSVRYVGGDNMLNVDNKHVSSAIDVANATESNVIGREVKPGEEVAFKVVMKAPARCGKAISYWRLKTADGTPFGHRLWCDVRVVSAASKAAEKDTQVDIASRGPVAAPFAPASIPDVLGDLLRNHMPSGSSAQRTQGGGSTTSVPSSQSYYTLYQQRMQALRQQEAQRRMMHGESVMHSERLARLDQGFNSLPRAAPLDSMGAYTSSVGQPAFASIPWKKQMEDFVERTSKPIQSTPVAPVSNQASLPAYSSSNLAVKGYQQALMDLEAANVKRRQAMQSAADKASESAIESEQKKSQEIHQQSETVNNADTEVLKGSQMIFPTLEKESPSSSTYQSLASSRTSKGKAAYVEDEATGIVTADAAHSSAETSEQATPSKLEPVSTQGSNTGASESESVNDGFEDVSTDLEVLSAESDSGEDDGFLTDEEYDILDASDSETVASAK